MRTPHHLNVKTYFLVHYGTEDIPDPDLWHGLPMTFGACRTDVREMAAVGSRFVFIANMKGQPKQTRYFLSAYFKVAERIGQDEALRRFGRRGNIDMDLLPSGETLAARATAYVTQHRHEIKWQGFVSVADVESQLEDHLVCLNGDYYIHAYWDAHRDWKRRVNQPYLVSDEVESRIFTPRIPYAELVRRCSALWAPDELQNRWGIHPKRNLTQQQIAELHACWGGEGMTETLSR